MLRCLVAPSGTNTMNMPSLIAIGTMIFACAVHAQEKPVPKDSVRVVVPGCTKGRVFTAGLRTEDQPGRSEVPPGMRLRMTGPRALVREIAAREGSAVEVTGLIKKGQVGRDGVSLLGGSIRLGPAPSPNSTSPGRDPGYQQIIIDVESWRPVEGSCPTR